MRNPWEIEVNQAGNASGLSSSPSLPGTQLGRMRPKRSTDITSWPLASKGSEPCHSLPNHLSMPRF